MTVAVKDGNLARRMQRVSGSAIMELLKASAKGDYISFASGLPDPALFPTEALAGIAEDVLTLDGAAALQYGPAEGYPPLRSWVAESLRARGLSAATPEHVLITNGSQQALDLVARAFVEPGEAVLVESPTYMAALQTFDSYETDYLIAPMDEDGMLVDRAATLIESRKPRLIFTLPNFQNPTGISMSLPRRQQLAEIAATHSLPLLEDDAYHDLRYEGEPLPPVCALADNPMALYMGTFSKIISPGLRVGYVYGNPALIARLVQLKQIADLHTGSFTQRLVYQFCERGLLEEQIVRIRTTYRDRCNDLLRALEKSFSFGATWTRPDGGMFLLMSLPEGIDASALLPEAMKNGVVYVPAAAFYPDGGGTNRLRLNFVSSSPDAISHGISILAELINSSQQ